MKFFEICADVLVPESTRAEVRLPGFGFRASWDGVFESRLNSERQHDTIFMNATHNSDMGNII